MPVPTYDRFIEPVLRFLARNPGGASAREAHEAAAEEIGLSEKDRAELIPSNVQPVYKNRAGWAHDRLKRAGLSSSPRRGVWQLTEEGLEYARNHSQPLDDDEVKRLALANLKVRLRARRGEVGVGTSGSEPSTLRAVGDISESPDDRLELALSEIQESVASELLEAIFNSSPKFFETLVLDLLHTLGYGASRSDLQRVGGSGDSGIDGVISLDRLGLEKVYVQAKRWKDSVGRPEVQAFYGALAGC